MRKLVAILMGLLIVAAIPVILKIEFLYFVTGLAGIIFIALLFMGQFNLICPDCLNLLCVRKIETKIEKERQIVETRIEHHPTTTTTEEVTRKGRAPDPAYPFFGRPGSISPRFEVKTGTTTTHVPIPINETFLIRDISEFFKCSKCGGQYKRNKREKEKL